MHKWTRTQVETPEEGEALLQRLAPRIKDDVGLVRNYTLERMLRVKGLRAPPINEALNSESVQYFLFAAKLAHCHLVPFIRRRKAGVRYLSTNLASFGIGRYRKQEALMICATMMVATHNRKDFQHGVPLPSIY